MLSSSDTAAYAAAVAAAPNNFPRLYQQELLEAALKEKVSSLFAQTVCLNTQAQIYSTED